MDKGRRGAIKEMFKFKVGDIIKISNEEDWGYIAKEDDKNFWIHWFVPLDADELEESLLYRYSKLHDAHKFEVV